MLQCKGIELWKVLVTLPRNTKPLKQERRVLHEVAPMTKQGSSGSLKKTGGRWEWARNVAGVYFRLLYSVPTSSQTISIFEI